MGADISNVGHPCRVGCCHIKLLLQMIRRHNAGASVLVPRSTSIARLRAYAVLAHDPGNTMPARALAHVAQVMRDFTIAIDTATVFPTLSNQRQESTVFFGTAALGMATPCIVAAGMHVEHRT